ncbi:MAG TPA: zinc ribbon domain-containing protein [Phycisphaerae bacterium]|nr:zinc ribbon domain-containing protein [Phycisphaerae bacterium]HRW53444.1 zinc ribbon domain-containing protein [Phycisphaerae bacterium]
MNERPHQDDNPDRAAPIGFCPHCDYQLLAPGVCPECGGDIPANKVRPRTRRDRRWRRIRRVFIATIALIAVVCLRYAYSRGYLYRLYTNGMLVDAYLRNPKVIPEIEQRLINNGFDDAEINALMDKSLVIRLSTRSPRPSDLRPLFRVSVSRAPGAILHFAASTRPGMPFKLMERLDDGEWLEVMPTGGELNLTRRTLESDIRFPELPTVGRHTFELRLDGAVEATNRKVNAAMKAWPTRAFIVSASTQFETVDQSVHSLIRFRNAPGDQQDFRRRIRLRADLASHSIPTGAIHRPDITICADPSMPALWFKLLSERRSPDGDISRAIYPALNFDVEAGYTQSANLAVVSVDVGDHLLLRLTPDIVATFEHGGDAFYPFRLEWDLDVDDGPRFLEQVPPADIEANQANATVDECDRPADRIEAFAPTPIAP